MSLQIDRTDEKTSLRIVRNGKHLHWPENFGRQPDRYRGAPGTVVDLDAPCEDQFLFGQESKLRPLTADELAAKPEPAPILNGRACAILAEHKLALSPKVAPPKPVEVIKDNAEAADAAVAAEDGPPAPDAAPKPPKTSKKTARKATPKE